MTNVYLQKVNSSGTPTLTYQISNIENLTIDYDTPVSAMPLPQNAADQNVLVKIEGNSEVISVSWVIKSETTSPASGTGLNSNPLTIFDQLMFFNNLLQPSSITDSYQISLADSWNGTVFTPNPPYFTALGFITKTSFNISSTETVTIRVNLSFIVGNVVTAYETNVPSEPTSVSLTTPSPGNITVNFSAPTDTSSGVLNYTIKRRTQLTPYKIITSTAATPSFADTGLTSGTTYYYQVAANATAGTGLYSAELSKAAT